MSASELAWIQFSEHLLELEAYEFEKLIWKVIFNYNGRACVLCGEIFVQRIQVTRWMHSRAFITELNVNGRRTINFRSKQNILNDPTRRVEWNLKIFVHEKYAQREAITKLLLLDSVNATVVDKWQAIILCQNRNYEWTACKCIAIGLHPFQMRVFFYSKIYTAPDVRWQKNIRSTGIGIGADW